MKLSIAAKFNLVFVSIFAVGFLAAGVVADRLLKESARGGTLQDARLLLGAAKSGRGDTGPRLAFRSSSRSSSSAISSTTSTPCTLIHS